MIKHAPIGELFLIRKGRKMSEVCGSDTTVSKVRYIQIEDLRDDTNPKYCKTQENAVMVSPNDIIIAWDGANAGISSFGLEGAIGSTLARLSPKSDNLYTPYVGAFVKLNEPYLRATCTGATIPHVHRQSLEGLVVPLPPLEVQKKIADTLNKAQTLLDNRHRQIELLDEFLQSVFLDMFGDPVSNPKGWDIVNLGELGALKNGINYSQDDKGYSIKCVGVGDFQSFHTIDDMESLSQVHLAQKLSDDYLLKNGDLLFVRSNGNKALVGRCVAVYPQSEDVTFSGFCIRFRITSEIITSVFLNYLFHTPAMKFVLLHQMRGANIQNLNQQMLKSMKIPLPPIELQDEFGLLIRNVRQQKDLMYANLMKMQNAFNSIMERAFKGELFS